MTKEECMEALSKHADITPVITSTVWKELEKENKEFFEEYWRNRENSCTLEVVETREMIQKEVITADQSSSTDKDSQDSKD
ncbi:hypothetical protein AQUCO_01000681v1 [Aquilegia coerulea]|uniref:Uncharacterized protein n=1 Tax=Aquilegia coerulea TaxID=218851 RepID=A0A2G5EB42_AQUCA|nr:hypothetical protein AQUCO_01000681v1 [Aquilegia coerulea]